MALMIQRLIELFMFRCQENSTLVELLALASNSSRWKEGHQLFQDIRRKTLKAETSGNSDLLKQYAFEELCAKTLYNLSGEPAPFDPDSSDYVVASALSLAGVVGVPEAEISDVVAANNSLKVDAEAGPALNPGENSRAP